jgi:hypothetical protein
MKLLAILTFNKLTIIFKLMLYILTCNPQNISDKIQLIYNNKFIIENKYAVFIYYMNVK